MTPRSSSRSNGIGPAIISDYRAISVINTIAKLVTKIMANRLQPHLTKLITTNQTAFMRGRSLMESFLSARELLNYCDKKKLPAILYKVDFQKAFDTVDWCFLINLLIERVFPPRWTLAILSILQSSTSSIRVNRAQSRLFIHKRASDREIPCCRCSLL